jgi:L,D-peptidoglycan transpeptidase YkuD (ErfK/YbiS/YcfS/YnhG family)
VSLTGIVTDVHGARALLRFGKLVTPITIGAGGIRTDKREGDRATPAGSLPLRQVLYRADRVVTPMTTLPREPLAPEDAWCDDVHHPSYNRRVRLPFEGRFERLWREDQSYNLLVILGWNEDPVHASAGSAIFLHVVEADGKPTDGCIGASQQAIQMMLRMGLDLIIVPPMI